MKRAKIALTAIALFAVVGGALAFKSYRGVTTFYKALQGGPGDCTTVANGFRPITNTLSGTVYATTVAGDPCTIRATLTTAQ